MIERLGGVADDAAPPSASQLASLTRRELHRGLAQAAESRQGYDRALAIPVLPLAHALAVAVPLDARIRSDATLLLAAPRGLVLLAAAVEALTLACELPPVTPEHGLALRYGDLDGALVLTAPWPRAAPPNEDDAELAALQLDERLDSADRLRAVAVALPAAAAALLVPDVPTVTAIGHRHPLDELEVLIRAGAEPGEAVAGPGSGPLDALVELALGARADGIRPHADPDPARRLARRMLQGLAGKRKWSGGTGAGYHTEVTHLMRGYDGADRELASQVVAALLEAGLLVEKVSVGQRHVSLHSRRKAEIEALIQRGEVPPSLDLPGGQVR